MVFLKVSLFVLLHPGLAFHQRHSRNRLPVLPVFRSRPDILYPLQHPAFPYGKQHDLMEQQALLVRWHGVYKLLLLRIQGMKKESLKLSCL